MKLEKDVIDLIKRTLKTAKLLKLDSIAIETEQIRAVNEQRTASVLEKEIPELGFAGLGIGRVSVLQSRLSVMEGEDFTVEATLLPNGVVRQLDIIGTNAKFEYRCANPSSIKAPRNARFGDMWSFTITDKTLNMLSKACSSVASDDVVIRSNSKGEMLMTLVDGTTSDRFTQKFDGDVQNLIDEDGDLEFEFTYNIDMFTLGLKNSLDDKGVAEILLTENGGIRTAVNNITIYIIPLADEKKTDD